MIKCDLLIIVFSSFLYGGKSMGKDLKGKELGKGLRQRKDGYYTARFVNKRGDREEKYFKKLQEARRWLEDARYEDRHSQTTPNSDMILDKWYEYWINLKSKSIRHTTLTQYESVYENHIRPILGDMVINKILPVNCQMVIDELCAKNYKPGSITRYKRVLCEIFNVAENYGIIISSPCKNLESVKTETQKDIVYLEIEEQKALLKELSSHPQYEMFAFVLQTGLRAGEVRGLTWDNIDFKNKMLYVRNNVVWNHKEGKWEFGELKTKNAIRDIPLTDEAIDLLHRMKEKSKQRKTVQIAYKNNIFTNRNGGIVDGKSTKTQLNKYAAKVGINKKIGMHALRHTFATRCIEAGMKPNVLQHILGHSTFQTTMNIYVHTTNNEKIKGISFVEEYLKVI